MLLGRDDELGRIDELLQAARSGRGAAVMLAGPAGIGKTALVAEAARRGDALGLRVLRAIGVQLEAEYPFGVVRQLFSPVVGPGRPSGDLLQGAAGLATSALGLSVEDSRVEDAGAAGSAAMHGLYWLTADLAERTPLLLAVDDAHCSDAMSLRFFQYLARRLEDLPAVVLLAARRPVDQSGSPLLVQLGALPGLELWRPAPLDEPQVARVIQERGLREADATFVAACYRASRGNPFLLGELLASLIAEGVSGSARDADRVATLTPEGVVRWVLARLRALGEEAERLAWALAVLGEDATLSDAVALAGVDRSAASGAADALIRGQILTAARSYEFAHPLVRAAVVEGLGRARRAEAHGRAARLVARRGAPVARVAAHLLASDPGADAWVVDVLRTAAREATASGDPRSAARYLERALEESQSPAARRELLLDLGVARLQAGLPGATQRMREAFAVCADARERAEISLV